MGQADTFRLDAVTLDESIARSTPDIEYERAAAIFDLVEESAFEPVGHAGGPYRLALALADRRLVLSVTTASEEAVATHILSLTPFRRIVKDYFIICESYYDAIRGATPSRIETIDMGRRGIHNEGAKVLMDRLEGKIRIDFDTARRLFTLICALHRRG